MRIAKVVAGLKCRQGPASARMEDGPMFQSKKAAKKFCEVLARRGTIRLSAAGRRVSSSTCQNTGLSSVSGPPYQPHVEPQARCVARKDLTWQGKTRKSWKVPILTVGLLQHRRFVDGLLDEAKRDEGHRLGWP